MESMRLVLAAGLLAVATARAEAPSPSAGPCAADLARFCKDTPSGDGRIRACLLAHEKELAPECRARIIPAASTGPAMGARELTACRGDLATHCQDVPSGGGRLRACLQEHVEALTPACKGVLARAKPR
ncbi:MAG TPA: cysteine rich repeat-containing protein [Candidatus Binatia bacterium]|nr:cysteine rich repeat-containing protein [Candidatus Binatia bacterium]